LGLSLLKNSGNFGYIIPDSYLEKDYFTDLRQLIVKQSSIIKNIRVGDDIFDEVNMPSSILLLKKENAIHKNFYFADISKEDLETRLNWLKENNQNIVFSSHIPEFTKSFIYKNYLFRKGKYVRLIDLYDQVMGVKVYQIGKGKPKQTEQEFKNNAFISKNKPTKDYYPFISQGIYRYYYETKNEFIKYGEWLAEPRELRYFTVPKIVVREVMNSYVYAMLIEYEAVVKNIAGVIIQKDKNYSLEYLLALINSKLFAFCIKEESPKSSNQAFPSINSAILKNLPIRELNAKNQKVFVRLANKMVNLYKLVNELKNDFLDVVSVKLKIATISTKLDSWYELEWNSFYDELAKTKTKILNSEMKEWKEFFNTEKMKIQAVLAEIIETDKIIDDKVYQLYDITPEEIDLIENAIK